MDHVLYLTHGPTADHVGVWLSEDIAEDLDQALSETGLSAWRGEASFLPDADPALLEATGRAIAGLSAAGGAAAIARVIHMMIHRNDRKKVRLMVDEDRSIEAEGLSVHDVQQLIESLRWGESDNHEGTEQSGKTTAEDVSSPATGTFGDNHGPASGPR